MTHDEVKSEASPRGMDPEAPGDGHEAAGARQGGSGRACLAWLPRLLLLLGVVLMATAVARTEPQKNGIYMDQMTFLLQALSMAHDADLRYGAEDQERFLGLGWGPEAVGLFLRQDGDTNYYAKPIAYSLAAVPFVRVSPNRGALFLNVLLWAGLLELSFRWLRRWMPACHAAVAALACWGLSAAGFYVFVIHPDICIMFLVSVVLYAGLAPCVAAGAGGPVPARPGALHTIMLGLASGLLIYEKLPAVFFPAAMLAMWWFRGLRRPAVAAFATAAIPVLVFAALHFSQDGSYSPYQGNRIVVTDKGPLSPDRAADNAYPSMETNRFFEARSARRWMSPGYLGQIASYLPSFTLHYAAGRKVGLFPYLTPFLVLAIAGAVLFRRRDAGTRLWVFAPFLCFVLFYFIITPLNYHGGPTALGNRYGSQVAPALLFLFGGAMLRPWASRALVPLLLIPAVLFPGRAVLSPATAVRDNYLVFQWNRFRFLPVEAELLQRGCDRFDSSVAIDERTRAFRLSEPDTSGTPGRYWLGAGALNRFAIVRAGGPEPPIHLRLSSASHTVEGHVVSGGKRTPFRLTAGSTISLMPDLAEPVHVPFGGMPSQVWTFELAVTSARETDAALGISPGAALHVQLAQPTPGYAWLAPDGTIAIDPGDPAAASLLLWGWWDASPPPNPERWAGGSVSSALALPADVGPVVPPVLPDVAGIRIEGHTVGGPLDVRLVAAGNPDQRFTLQPNETTITMPLIMSADKENTRIIRLDHAETRTPAVLLDDPAADSRALTGLYRRLVLVPKAGAGTNP